MATGGARSRGAIEWKWPIFVVMLFNLWLAQDAFLSDLLWHQVLFCFLFFVLWIAENLIFASCKTYLLNAAPVAAEVQIGLHEVPYSRRFRWNRARICIAAGFLVVDLFICATSDQCTESLVSRIATAIAGCVGLFVRVFYPKTFSSNIYIYYVLLISLFIHSFIYLFMYHLPFTPCLFICLVNCSFIHLFA
jgi:hypothetical protein